MFRMRTRLRRPARAPAHVCAPSFAARVRRDPRRCRLRPAARGQGRNGESGRPTPLQPRTTRCSREIIRGRSSSSRSSRRAFPTAAMRSRRSSSARTRTIAPARPPPAVAACDRFIRTYPNHPNVDYAYYLKGLVQFPRGPGTARLRVRARPRGARSQGDARVVRRVQGARRQVSGQPVCAGRDRRGCATSPMRSARTR